MVDWTYTRKYTAWLGDVIVTIPDQIADDQMRHDKAGTVFPARYHSGVAALFRGGPVLVRLDGEAYDLHGPETGDCIVKQAFAGWTDVQLMLEEEHVASIIRSDSPTTNDAEEERLRGLQAHLDLVRAERVRRSLLP
jgi:hypothetical protein